VRDAAEYPDSVVSINPVICKRLVTGCVSGMPAVHFMAKMGGMLINCSCYRRLGRGSRGL